MTSGPPSAVRREPARPCDSRVRRAVQPRERRSIVGMSGFVLLLHVVGWGVLVFAVAPHEYRSAAPASWVSGSA